VDRGGPDGRDQGNDGQCEDDEEEQVEKPGADTQCTCVRRIEGGDEPPAPAPGDGGQRDDGDGDRTPEICVRDPEHGSEQHGVDRLVDRYDL
jgi:hypothetical protein